jgi:hypothetical protein
MRASLVAFVLVLVAGCQCGSGPLTSVRPLIEVSPATLDFGTVTRGERAERVVVVRNPGRVSLTVREVVLDGDGAAQFQLGEAEPATVRAGAEFALKVLYAPSAVGAHGARLLVRSDAFEAPEVAVALTGQAVPPDACAGVTCDQPPGPCFEAVGTCSGGGCSYAPKADGVTCDDGDACTENDACVAGACSGAPKACVTPPAGHCASDMSFTSYASPGACVAGSCEYTATTRTCSEGCSDGVCKPDLCLGVTCTNPPPCFKGGACVSGSCQYEVDVGAACDDGNGCTQSDVCSAAGVCRGTAVACQSPPSPVCVTGQTLRTADAVGFCGGAGVCAYVSRESTCPYGCLNGACQGNPCIGVSCTMPPPNTCADATTRRTYPASGVCAAGTCDYAPTDTPCGTSEVCQVGQCRWNDARLTNLTVTPGAVSFSPTQTVYAVAVPLATTSVAVTATVAQPARATVRINNAVTASGTPVAVTLTGPVTTVAVRVDAESGASMTYTLMVLAVEVWAQQAYVKASDPEAGDFFGSSVALSADGSTLAVGAYHKASRPSGNSCNLNASGYQSLCGCADASAGVVYLFARTAGVWGQQARLTASNISPCASFGMALALSADGRTLVVGAPDEASSATGLNGNQGDTSAPHAGAVYVFSRTGASWVQQAYVKASNTRAYNFFGEHLALSADGSTLAVGAWGEDSSATGVDGNQGDYSAPLSGAVYVYRRAGTIWAQQAYVKASNTEADDRFGESLALNEDGSTLAVGAPKEDSSAIGVNGNQADNSFERAGAAYVFIRTGSTWAQQAYVKASNAGAGDAFGWSVALSADGSTLAVGAWGEDSSATGVDGNQSDNAAPNSGAAYVFTRNGAIWTQQAYVKAMYPDAADFFGGQLALSADGNTLAVGAWGEDSSATGVNGNQADNSFGNAGAAYVFIRTGTAWAQRGYLKASNLPGAFGDGVAVSGDGSTVAVGVVGDPSGVPGINVQPDLSALNAGAVYVFTR